MAKTLLKKLKSISKAQKDVIVSVGKDLPWKDSKKKEEKEELNYSINSEGQYVLEGDEALWLAEACKENTKKKAAEKKLKKLKKQLDFKDKGEYVNTAGDKVVVTVSEKKSDIDPLRLFKLLKKNKMVARFWGCVKVQVGEVKKVVPESSIDKMQHDLDPIIKCSFK